MIALLPSPWVQWKRAPLRVMLVTEKLLQGETSLTGLDGSVAASGGLRFPALPPGGGVSSSLPRKGRASCFQRMNRKRVHRCAVGDAAHVSGPILREDQRCGSRITLEVAHRATSGSNWPPRSGIT